MTEQVVLTYLGIYTQNNHKRKKKGMNFKESNKKYMGRLEGWGRMT